MLLLWKVIRVQVLAASDNLIDVFIWVGILFVMVALFWLAWVYARKWSMRDGSEPLTPWTLQDLRELKDRGELSENEYQTLREQIIAQHKDTEIESV